MKRKPGIGSIASAGTTSLVSAGQSTLVVTGTTTIASLGIAIPGDVRQLIFEGILTLTHSASLLLPTSANITTAAGDAAIVIATSTGWKVLTYQRADGRPLAGSTPTSWETTATESVDYLEVSCELVTGKRYPWRAFVQGSAQGDLLCYIDDGSGTTDTTDTHYESDLIGEGSFSNEDNKSQIGFLRTSPNWTWITGEIVLAPDDFVLILSRAIHSTYNYQYLYGVRRKSAQSPAQVTKFRLTPASGTLASGSTVKIVEED